MNKWVKKKWVRSLRSREYHQGQGALVRAYGVVPKPEYCCLGVLIAECYPEAIIENGTPRAVEHTEKMIGSDWVATDLLAVWEMDDTQQRRLGGLNDSGKTFLEIADYIEENL